jgi:predicted phage terminase large subunit-like protein
VSQPAGLGHRPRSEETLHHGRLRRRARARVLRSCDQHHENAELSAALERRFKSTNVTAWEVERENPEDDDQTPTMIAAGILSAMTGQGATDLEVDDPVKNHEEAYSSVYREKCWNNYVTTAGTRMAPNGRKILVMTRWHEDDLAGRLLKKSVEDKKADQWVVICLAAINDDGESSYVWNTRTGEKRFLPKYEALWPEAFPREYPRVTAREPWICVLLRDVSTDADDGSRRDLQARQLVVLRRLPGWNSSSRFTTRLTRKVRRTTIPRRSPSVTAAAYAVLDAWRDKLGFPALVARVYGRWDECIQRLNRRPDRVLVENKGSGISLIQQIEANNLSGIWTFPDGQTRHIPMIPVTPMPATTSKVIRAQGVSGYHESKLCLLPKSAPWLDDFKDELALFPRGPHDDWTTR